MSLGLVLATLFAAAPVADAATQLYSGDAVGALRAAEKVLLSSPTDAPAAIVTACAAIESGQLGRADAAVRLLENIGSAPSRARVLRQLVRVRARSPELPLTDALATAWRESGRPQLEAAPGAVGAHAPPPLADGGRLAPAVRLLFAPPDDREELRRIALEATREAARNPLVANLRVLGALANLDCPEDPRQQRAAVARVLEVAIRQDPGNGYVVLAGWLAGCPSRLDRAGIAILERASAMRELRLPRQRAFREMEQLAQRVDPERARLRAISSWLALDGALARLGRLAAVVADPEARPAAGRALEAVAWRVAEGDAWLERLLGASLARDGARLTGDPGRIRRAEERSELEQRAYARWTDARRRMGEWPFAAEWREWTPDEVAASRRLLEIVDGERPGSR